MSNTIILKNTKENQTQRLKIAVHQEARDGMSIFRKRCVFQYIYEDFISILKTTLSSRRNLTTDEQSKI